MVPNAARLGSVADEAAVGRGGGLAVALVASTSQPEVQFRD